MKALLIATLISVNGGAEPVDIDQMHIWFEGPSAHVDCVRTEQELALGKVTVTGGEKVSSQAAGSGWVTRKTQCVKFV